MSIFTDAFRILEEESNLFSFLPAINQSYIYWKANDPSNMQTAIVMISLLVSVTAFNIITYGDFDRYKSESETMEAKYALLLVTIALIWTLSLLYSLTQLYREFSTTEAIPTILTLVSLVFIFLLATHAILINILPMYNHGE